MRMARWRSARPPPRRCSKGPNQYPPTRGRPELRRAIADHAKRFYDLDFNPDTEVLVTSGATEALTACIMGLVGPGGEIVLIEPAYDSYRPIAEAVGAVVRTVTLIAAALATDRRGAFARPSRQTHARWSSTRRSIPSAACSIARNWKSIARVIARTNATVICDEVYEHLVFDGRKHIPLMTLPGMRERVVRVGSAGKMFSLTGWKVGWVTGAAALIDAIAKAHQFLTFTTSPALQLGVAHALEHEIDFTLNLTSELQAEPRSAGAGPFALGFEVLPCEGTYFLTADISALTNEPDLVFCERLVREAGVALIPLRVSSRAAKPDHLVRFAFCKRRA